MKQQLQHSIKIMLAEQKKKAGVLAALLLLLAGVVVKNTLLRGGKPAEATADTGSASEVMQGMGRAAVGRAIASIEGSTGTRVIEAPSSPRLTRDLFALDPAHFPAPAQPEPSSTIGGGTAKEQVESPVPSADELRAAREAQLVSETESWNLRSVMLGAAPAAVIDLGATESRRQIVRAGQTVKGWKLAEVGPSHALFVKESVNVRLTLSAPQR